MYLLYQLVLGIAALILFPYYLLRAAARPGILRHLGERLGGGGSVRWSRPAGLWIHAASVGEVQVARVLVERLRLRRPDLHILLSVTTPTGREVARRTMAGAVDGPFFFPLDFAFSVRRVLRRLRPAAFVAVETEIWPVLLRECRSLGIPHGIVNGRISPRSFRRYRWIRALLRPALSGAAFLSMQSEPDAERIRDLGAPADRVRITGNLKYDFEPDTAARDRLGPHLVPGRGGQVVIAGSTRRGEERPLLRAWREVRDRIPAVRLIIAPRHPERFDEVAALIEAEGFSCRRRSRGGPPPAASGEVLLLDSIGELANAYGLAACAFVGGSLVARGGQNPLEPAAWGVPVLFGPHMENFQTVADDLLEAGGAIRVPDPDGIAPVLVRLLESTEERRRASAAARECARRHRGAVDATTELVLRVAGDAFPAVSGTPGRFGPGAALAPLAWVYGLMVRRRNRGFDLHPDSAGRADLPVVSVGNLAVGGTGKTPITLALARFLRNEGWEPVIVSRGYGRRGRSGELRTVEPGNGEPLQDARRYGDEPTLMARNLHGVPVVVCRDRLRAVRHARDRFGVDIAILDDGYQHRRLHRDLDLLLIDSMNPFGNGRLLPAGPLREPLREIRRASAVLLTRWNLGPGDGSLVDAVRRWGRPDTPVFRFRQRCLGLLGPIEGNRGGLEQIGQIPVLAFAGIGNPDSFAAELNRSGMKVRHTVWFRDHHPYSVTDRNRIVRMAARMGAEVLLTTEKDRMRFPVEGCPLPVYALEVALEPMEEQEFHRFLRRGLPLRSTPRRPAEGEIG